MDRPLEIAGFLEQQGWGDASAQAFDGDFSPRRYARLTRPDGSRAILMDADEDQHTAQFVRVDGILRKTGIEAPEIYAALPERGLVLMQDFGARNVGGLLDAGGEANGYFRQAAEMLAKLHRGFVREETLGMELPLFHAGLFGEQVELFLDGYFVFNLQREASAEERRDFRAAWQVVLRPVDVMPKSLLLRDFMPDNLMELADGGLGVLDFQDAGVGPVAYDLASLCEEVRRDGGYALVQDVVAHYRDVAQSALSQADIMRACVILSAERHMRILGILTQLAMKKGRRDKLDLLPRVKRHLQKILREPYLLPVREWLGNFEGLDL